MNDQDFFDLVMKASAGRCTDAERAELDSLLESRPELRAEMEKFLADAMLAREVLPLLAAVESSAGEFPAYARERLQTQVRQTLGRPVAAGRKGEPEGGTMLERAIRPMAKHVSLENEREVRAKHLLRWVFGLAATTAVVVVLLIPMLTRPSVPVVQVALLDTVGTVRGSDTNEIGLLKQEWRESEIRAFDTKSSLDAWESSWPRAKFAAKVIYDRAAGEVRVSVRRAGATQQKAFSVDKDLGTTLRQADEFIREQTARRR